MDKIELYIMGVTVLVRLLCCEMFPQSSAPASFRDSLFTQLATALAALYQLRMLRQAYKFFSYETFGAKKKLWCLMMLIHCFIIAAVIFMAAFSASKSYWHTTYNLPIIPVVVFIYLLTAAVSTSLLVMSAEWFLISVSCVAYSFFLLHVILCQMSAFGLTPIFSIYNYGNFFKIIAFSCIFPFPLYFSGFAINDIKTSDNGGHFISANTNV